MGVLRSVLPPPHHNDSDSPWGWVACGLMILAIFLFFGMLLKVTQ